MGGAFVAKQGFAEAGGVGDRGNGVGAGEGGDAAEAEGAGQIFDNAAMEAAFGEEGFQLLREGGPGFGGEELAVLGEEGLGCGEVAGAYRSVAEKVQAPELLLCFILAGR